jgi:hypothetical protein
MNIPSSWKYYAHSNSFKVRYFTALKVERILNFIRYISKFHRDGTSVSIWLETQVTSIKKVPWKRRVHFTHQKKKKKNAHWLLVLYGLWQIRLAFDVYSMHITQYESTNSGPVLRESELSTTRPSRPSPLWNQPSKRTERLESVDNVFSLFQQTIFC